MRARLKNIKKKLVKKIVLKNKPLIIGLFLISIIGIIVVPSIFAFLQPVKSIEILSSSLSYSSKEGGAWRVTNSAEFISNNTALVTMDLDTISYMENSKKDVVFLIDTSESMTDERLSALKSGVVASIENILKDTNNKVGIVSFNSSATIVSNLSNSKSTLVSKVNSLNKETGTSYYQALKQVESMLKSYTNSSSREFNVVLITDGVPSKDSPNEVALYKYLKDAYPFINISGVQYEAGDSLLDEIKSVSDKQYLTKIDSFSDVLSNIVKSVTSYGKFYIKEHLNNDNFMVESINDIKVDSGSVELNNNVITWNLDNMNSGSKAKMTLKVKLKTTSNGIYELNNNLEVNSRIDNIVDTVTSTNTPVLSNNYKVKYDGNKPSDCTISGVPSDTTHKVFETVSIADSPKCSGYQFKGWDIVTDNVTKVNDDYFIMPEEDVELKAKWSKLTIKKSTDGEVEEGWTLYKQVKSDAGSSNRYAKKYTGDTSTFTGNNDVYYYYGAAANNNVVFANYCWKIVRTTDTGGVKLLYNGVPSNGTCNNTGTASSLTAEEMGTSSNEVNYNAQYKSVADVGYMNNIKYNTLIVKSSNLESNTKFYKSFEYSNGTYKLMDEYYAPATKYHYSCLNKESECSEIKYVFYSGSGNYYYITLTNGKGIEDALGEMLFNEDVNKNDSVLKAAIDTWYRNNMIQYTSYLEDTVFCNDRSINNIGGWSNGGYLNEILKFGYYNNEGKLICPNKNDRFTVNSANGNGALTYPVGVLTAQEVKFAQFYDSSDAFNPYKSPLKGGKYFWTMTPFYINYYGTASVPVVDTNGLISFDNYPTSYTVRPVVSLRAGMEYSVGDGSSDHPYVIATDSFS